MLQKHTLHITYLDIYYLLSRKSLLLCGSIEAFGTKTKIPEPTSCLDLLSWYCLRWMTSLVIFNQSENGVATCAWTAAHRAELSRPFCFWKWTETTLHKTLNFINLWLNTRLIVPEGNERIENLLKLFFGYPRAYLNLTTQKYFGRFPAAFLDICTDLAQRKNTDRPYTSAVEYITVGFPMISLVVDSKQDQCGRKGLTEDHSFFSMVF